MSSTAIATPRGPVTIRPTTAGDARALRDLRVVALSTSPTSFSSPPEEVDTFDWTAIATGNADEAVFVAEHAGSVVGLTGIRRAKRPKERHHADLWGVFVQPAWRRLGVAQALVNAACDWARDAGVAIVKLTVVPESGGRGCYERCGFVVTGVDPAALYHEGRYYDELLMHRWVQPNGRGGV